MVVGASDGSVPQPSRKQGDKSRGCTDIALHIGSAVRNQHKDMEPAIQEPGTGDLAPVVDGRRVQELPAGIAGYESVEVVELAAAPRAGRALRSPYA